MANENTSDFFGISNLVEKITIERRKTLDNAVLGEIREIASDNGIESKLLLNEKAIVEALTDYIVKHEVLKNSPTTYFEKFKQMSVDELAEKIYEIDDGQLDFSYCNEECPYKKQCDELIESREGVRDSMCIESIKAKLLFDVVSEGGEDDAGT